jgi:ferredoxin
VFEVNDDGELVLLREGITDGELDAVQRAVDSCPTAALRLLEH